jgi:putative ABC transport system substrate-binding protein
MRRRDFVAALGGAAAWPFAARAQQAIPTVPLIYDAIPSEATPFVAAFQRGLAEVGFADGQNELERREEELRKGREDLAAREAALVAKQERLRKAMEGF